MLSGGVTPDQVRPFFAKAKGWEEEQLRRGHNEDGGWVVREYAEVAKKRRVDSFDGIRAEVIMAQAPIGESFAIKELREE